MLFFIIIKNISTSHQKYYNKEKSAKKHRYLRHTQTERVREGTKRQEATGSNSN
jgi:hypothetical protein